MHDVCCALVEQLVLQAGYALAFPAMLPSSSATSSLQMLLLH
jgi:hypothetical protein